MPTKSKSKTKVSISISIGGLCLDDLGEFKPGRNEIALNPGNPIVTQAKQQRNNLAVATLGAFLLTLWAVQNQDEATELLGVWDGAGELFTISSQLLAGATIKWN